MPRRDEPALDAREHRYGRGHKGVRAWEVTGDANDLTFVLVHGLGVSSSLFREVTDRLRHLGRVVVYDLPGFGGVPHPRDPMSIGEFASVMGASLIDLGITEPVLVGHSMGAQVAAELAAHAADRRRVVLKHAPHGHEVASKFFIPLGRRHHDALTDVSDADLATFLGVLDAVADALAAHQADLTDGSRHE